MQRICRRWYQVHRNAIRRYDPNHLILGDRNTLHLQPLPEYAIRIIQPYVDVLSVNVMGPPQIVYGVLEDATRVWDGPIHLADTGSGIYSGGLPKSTYQARDLAEFEKVYAGMMKMGLEINRSSALAGVGSTKRHIPADVLVWSTSLLEYRFLVDSTW